MFDPTLHPTMFSPLQVLGDLQQCLSQPYPSKKSGVCLNHNNHVWPGKIRSSLFGVDNREPIRGMVLTCLYRSQDLSPLYLLLVQAPDFKSRWGRWCARKILFHESPPECQHTWAEYKCPLPSMVVHSYRGTWSSFRHWHVWGAADDDEKLDDQRLRVNGVEQVGVSWIIIIRNLESFNDVSLLCPFPPRVDEVKYTCLGPGDRNSVSESPLNNTNYHRKILFRAQVACTKYSRQLTPKQWNIRQGHVLSKDLTCTSWQWARPALPRKCLDFLDWMRESENLFVTISTITSYIDCHALPLHIVIISAHPWGKWGMTTDHISV